MLRNTLICLTAAASALAGEFECARALLAPARPCPYPKKDTQGAPKIEASFLYWQSKMFGLEFASKSEIPSDPASPTQTFQQKLYVPDFAWRTGIKVNCGYNLPYDGWDAEARYTYARGEMTSLKKHIGSEISPEGLGVVPLWHYPFIQIITPPPIAPLRFRNAAANWKLYFNTFDLEFGREFLTLRSLPLRMHLGAKIAWIRQNYQADYNTGTSFRGALDSSGTVNLQYVSSKMAFALREWGIGPRAGFESKWNIGCGFSLIADAALSLLSSFTSLSTRFDDYLQNLSAASSIEYHMNLEEKIRELLPVGESRLGFDWGRCFCNCGRPIYFGATIAYETQYWWSLNHARRNYPYEAPANMWDSRGDLQMQGLTATLRWDY